MIGTCLYKGQGFGNQLWVYAVTRAAALRWGFEFSILNSNYFKGSDFLKLDFGKSAKTRRRIPSNEVPSGFTKTYFEKKVIDKKFNCDISPFDPDIWRPVDGTLLEGPLQSENYILDYKDQISRWFRVESEQFDGCVINIRGGEYKNNRDLFLGKDYYRNAISKIRDIDSNCDFLIVTDDPSIAHDLFPEYSIKSSGGVKIILNRFYRSPKSRLIGNDFSLVQNAKYLILSNSSFSWWGAWTNPYAEFVIAPKYWARHNVSDGFWSQGDSLTRGWHWLDRKGVLSEYEECAREISKHSVQSKDRSRQFEIVRTTD